MSLSDTDDVTEMEWEDQSGLTSAHQNDLLDNRAVRAVFPHRQNVVRPRKRKRKYCAKCLLIYILPLALITVSFYHFTLTAFAHSQTAFGLFRFIT